MSAEAYKKEAFTFFLVSAVSLFSAAAPASTDRPSLKVVAMDVNASSSSPSFEQIFFGSFMSAEACT